MKSQNSLQKTNSQENPILNDYTSQLGKMDALIAAPDSHHVLFENDTIRILNVVVLPKQIVPFHTHQWDSITITLQSSRFKVEDLSGNVEIENESDEPVPIIDFLKGSHEAYSYCNLGSKEFKAIVLEFKK